MWSRLASLSITVVAPGRREACQQHRRFDLRGRNWRAVDDRERVASALQGDRQPPARFLAQHPRADLNDRVDDAPHRPLAQRGVAIEDGGDRAAGHSAHHQPAAGGGIAEVEHTRGLAEAADPDPVHPPLASAQPLDTRPQGRHGLAGVEHVLAFEQARNPRFADCQGAEDEGAVRNRLVAGHAYAPPERTRSGGR